MNPLEFVVAKVRRTGRRRQFHRAWLGFWRGFLFASLLWCLTLAAYKVFPLPLTALLWGSVTALAAWGLGLLWGFWQRPSLLETARWLDRQTGLEDRLTTALELSQSQAPPEWRQLQLADAAAHVQKVNEKGLLSWRLPRSIRWTFLLLLLGASLGFVPEYRSRAYAQKQKEQDNMREVGKQIAELTRRSLDRHPPALAPVEKAMGSVVELGDELSKAKLSRSEALREVAKVTDRLQETANELKQNPALKNLEQARRHPSGGTSPANSLQKQEAARKTLEKQIAAAEALANLKQELEKALQTGAGLQNPDSAEGQQARQQLSKSLAALGDRAKSLGQSIPGLEEAMAALEQNNPDLFVQDLKTALMELDKIQENAKALEKLAQQSVKAGKDLGEQLNRVELQAAAQTLQNMIQKLASSQLDKEQLQKILEEVQKAVDPAGKYGKVAEHLAKGARNLQLGQKGSGAQSLKDAAAELDKLMRELNDMDALMASLEALRRADLALGTCTGLGQCQRPGGGFSPGGRPGSGVGTWADEGWAGEPGFTERWDNSGVFRPDLDPRGHTDRGEGNLSDNLAPTKVRGQLSPGGSMPSITLKGVSVKGQSKIAFQEVLAAAQKEAQSAISQEQVPRAYQGAVKDYFDDLKE